MASPGSGSRRQREELEDCWRQRVEDALEAYRALTADYKTLLEHQPEGVAPESTSPLAQARRAQSEALREYSRVLAIFSDLVIHGKLPDDFR